jgi:hypothetical protein
MLFFIISNSKMDIFFAIVKMKTILFIFPLNFKKQFQTKNSKSLFFVLKIQIIELINLLYSSK